MLMSVPDPTNARVDAKTQWVVTDVAVPQVSFNTTTGTSVSMTMSVLVVIFVARPHVTMLLGVTDVDALQATTLIDNISVVETSMNAVVHHLVEEVLVLLTVETHLEVSHVDVLQATTVHSQDPVYQH